MKKYDWNVKKLREIVKNCINFGEVLDALQIPRQGNNTKTLRGILDKEEIDYSHFTGRAREYAKPGVKDINYYLANQGFIKTSKLKEKLLKEGIKENKCEICGITEWNGKPLVMQLHHIDGNNKNNSLDNLQMLCPNCHSQTDNYCGSANITEETKKKYYCPDCGKEINKGSKYCSVCYHKHQNKSGKCPEMEQLIKDYLELKSFSSMGNKYDVTDSSIRKWFKNYGLPEYAKVLKKYLSTHSIEEIKEDLKNNNIHSEKTSNVGGQFKYDYNLILKLIDLQYTVREISEYIGCSVDTIKKVGSKYKHSIRKATNKCIGCFENGKLIKFCFGGTQTAHWLMYEKGFNKYSKRTLESMILPAANKGILIDNVQFKIIDLPNISKILEEHKEKALEALIYKDTKEK